MVEAISKELLLRQHEVDKPLKTIYFGGGTPSVLNEKELSLIFSQIEKNFEIDPKAEITLETNPDDLNADKINMLKHFPVNRFSIGIQSFFEEDLVLMNRAHNAQQAESSVKRAQDAGFENISIDLIYGAPTTADAMWQTNLNKAVELQVPHISSYALTIEPKTALNHKINKGQIPKVDEAKQENQFQMLVETLLQHGFEHYEISNFALPGFRSLHNSAYWKGAQYIGIGPSAHSFDGRTRSWNVANNSRYIHEIQQNRLPAEKEILSPEDIINELTMIGLRWDGGIDLERVQNAVPEEIFEKWHAGTKRFIEEGKILEKEGKLLLNPAFRFFADGIASDLFIV